jgi:hypothetical protein
MIGRKAVAVSAIGSSSSSMVTTIMLFQGRVLISTFHTVPPQLRFEIVPRSTIATSMTKVGTTSHLNVKFVEIG